jgi:hypothetical protein
MLLGTWTALTHSIICPSKTRTYRRSDRHPQYNILWKICNAATELRKRRQDERKGSFEEGVDGKLAGNGTSLRILRVICLEAGVEAGKLE